MTTTSTHHTATTSTLNASVAEANEAPLYGPAGQGWSLRPGRLGPNPGQSRRKEETTSTGSTPASFQALLAAGPAPRSNGRTCKVCVVLDVLDASNGAALRAMIADTRWTRQAIADAASTWGLTITRSMVSQHERAGHDNRV